MKRVLTNRLGLPAPLVRAVANDSYDAGNSDATVTRLLQPPRKVELERLHQHEIVEDASSRIFALLGQVSHLILERAADNSICEKRLFTEVLGWKVSGQVDLMPEERKIIDYKLSSIFSVKDGLKPEFEQQVNLLAFLCRANGLPEVQSAQIIVILRDWFLSKSRRDPNYPQEQVVVLDVPIWSAEEQEAFMLERVKAHQDARRELPECTQEETWNWKRCADWCNAFPWCRQSNPNAE
jgi:hypothetical protein